RRQGAFREAVRHRLRRPRRPHRQVDRRCRRDPRADQRDVAMTAPRRLAGFCFDHMHMGDLLGKALRSDAYEVVGVYDTQLERMAEVCADLGIGDALQFTDWLTLIESTRPEVAVVCSTTAEHTDWVERLASRGIHVLLEKPFAVSAEEARRAIDLAEQ